MPKTPKLFARTPRARRRRLFCGQRRCLLRRAALTTSLRRRFIGRLRVFDSRWRRFLRRIRIKNHARIDARAREIRLGGLRLKHLDESLDVVTEGELPQALLIRAAQLVLQAHHVLVHDNGVIVRLQHLQQGLQVYVFTVKFHCFPF